MTNSRSKLFAKEVELKDQSSVLEVLSLLTVILVFLYFSVLSSVPLH